MPDNIAIAEEISVVLNDPNTKFQDLSDSFSFSDASPSVAAQPVLSDSLSISGSIAFEKEFRLYETVTLTEGFPNITGLLFGYQEETDAIAITSEASASARDSVFETGDYGTSKVFVITDLTTVGVFE